MNDNGYIELLPVAVTKHIQHSWLEVENHLKQAGNLMFKRLTDIEPQLKQLNHYFQLRPSTELKDQCYIFMTTLDDVVNIIRCVDCLEARKNFLIGIRKSQETTEQHCLLVEDALTWTLMEILDDKFTTDMKESWKVFFKYMWTMTNPEELSEDLCTRK